MIRVLIVDDHLIIRRGLRQILAEQPAIDPVADAADAAEALACLRAQEIDVVLLDVALGDRDGLDLLTRIRAEFPSVGVLMLSVYPEAQFAQRAIRSGASGYLNKGCSPSQLTAAIEKVASGGLFVSAELAERLAGELRSAAGRAPHESLSNREYQVLQLLVLGESVSAIAARLNLSVNTVSTYRARVFDKLGLRNAADLFSYASRHGLVAL
ncbi:response regulator transcription factor [soil metagenome]